jgi:mono/diheme cytochrome c family protein
LPSRSRNLDTAGDASSIVLNDFSSTHVYPEVLMRRGLTIFSIVVLLLALGCARDRREGRVTANRGKYLLTIGGCHDCHTPKVPGPNGAPFPDKTRLLSGHPEKEPPPSWSPEDLKQKGVAAATNIMLTAWAGPWGVSYASNLTPDKETGIGEWSADTFIVAMRTGKHQGQPNGRNILPPMPWFNLKEARDTDLKSIWEYLRSIPPVKNQVPFPTPPGAAQAPGREK